MQKIVTKHHLFEYLSFIRDCELEKPLKGINEELITAHTHVLLKLQHKDTSMADEELSERINNIPFVITPDFNNENLKKNKKRIRAKRILIIAATIALLYALMASIISYSHSTDDQFLRDIIETIGLENIVYGKEYNVNGTTYIENEYIAYYDDITDYPKDNPYNILLPTYMPKDTRLGSISVANRNNGNYTVLVSSNIPTLSYEMYPDTKIPQVIIDNAPETTVINGKTVYIVEIPDVGQYQMYFEYNGDYYELVFTDKEELIKIIESME